MQTFDEFLERFEDLFKRTITSEEDKEEGDFEAEFAELVQVLQEFKRKSRKQDDWSDIFIQMQGEISTFKKSLRTLDREGQCWKHVRNI